MATRRVETADEFHALAGPLLTAHEAEHNLALGLLGRLRVEPRLYGFDPAFIVALDGDDVVGCLLRTPPHGVVLSRFESLAAVDEVAAAVHEVYPSLPGGVGPSQTLCLASPKRGRDRRGLAAAPTRQRVHAAAVVEDLPRAPGRMREAVPDDIPLVLEWLRAFGDEALGHAPHVEDAEASYQRREADPNGAWLVWDDGGVVSLAAYGNPTPSGNRVGPVYTPTELRGRGYATSLVAELTAERLASGLAFCFLFTDLANPTSNAIYKRIGYEPVADWDQWAFASPALQK